jgi:hypothetical protein
MVAAIDAKLQSLVGHFFCDMFMTTGRGWPAVADLVRQASPKLMSKRPLSGRRLRWKAWCSIHASRLGPAAKREPIGQAFLARGSRLAMH